MSKISKHFDLKVPFTDLSVYPAVHLFDLWICGVAYLYDDGEIDYDIDQIFEDNKNVLHVVKAICGSLKDYPAIALPTMNHVKEYVFAEQQKEAA